VSETLQKLARIVGIEEEYLAIDGETRRVSDAAKVAALKAMGLAGESEQDLEASLASVAAVDLGAMRAPEGATCYVPDWLKDGRCWGVACQLYGLRSARNWGIGDFEDLARFAELAAAEGADFVGVNPLHALFLAEPERNSPFSPSNRQFLNPLYIAVDKVPGAERLGDALAPPEELQRTELVDYRAVAERKKRALERLYRIFADAEEDEEAEDFGRFCVERGQPLYLHALYEALSEHMAQQGHGATWHGWPEEYQHPAADAVRAFSEEQADRVTFQSWLQWLADRQLAEAQARGRAAGLRIGLYLDLAVGVAPDGSGTWSDRELVVPGARIGAPPDYYNAAGQDWGLAPLSPANLAARDFVPYRESMEAVLAHAGALRIDHAMSLYRLFWIAEGHTAADGVYVRYPFPQMLKTLAEVSQARQAVVIGEDLGVVPEGFREVMREMEIQSYRVFFFEKRKDRFLPPDAYPREALACITTHDLQTLAGWWSGRDLAMRLEIGLLKPDGAEAAYAERAHERRRVLGLLEEQGLLPPELAPLMRGEEEAAPDLPESFAVALHRLVARTPSRLFVVPAEDLIGSAEQVNVPGTMDEHPNWRRKLPVALDELTEQPMLRAIVAVLNEERPRS
jgi:4-alpha-glucanotransferase